MSQFVRLLQNGIMDKDTDTQLVSSGNYVDGLNIRHRDDNGSNLMAIAPIRSNNLKVTIPDPTETVAVWRAYIKAETQITSTISLFRNGAVTTNSVSGFFGNILLSISSINPATDQLIFAAPHGFTSGQVIIYNNPLGTAASPLVSGQYYFVEVISSTAIRLHRNQTLTDLVDITTAGTGTQTLTLTPLLSLVAQAKTSLTALSGTFSYTPTVIESANEAYFDITNPAFSDFELFESGNLIDRFIQLSEYVQFVGTSPKFKVIGMESVGNDTIVFSTTPNFLTTNIDSDYESLNEIGVIEHDSTVNTYTYTRLLRSKQLRFNVDNQIQADLEKRTQDVNIYWTDNLNKPRVLSVPYPYVQDGVLSSNGGTIDISKVDKETSLFTDTPSANITLLAVSEGAGSLLCGNKRYTGRFVTDDFVGTDYLYPTGLINIFKAPSSIPSEVKGDRPGTITSKGIKLQVSNIPPGEFTYFELIAIEYEGETFTVKMVQRYRLNNETSIIVEHTNNGQDNFPLAPVDILALTSKITRVKSLRIASNRLFLSNVAELIDKDLTLWASQITHSLEITTITSVGRSNRFGKNDTDRSYPNYRFGEYQDHQNVLNRTGYMMNDTYRFGIQVQWKETGKWSSPYYLDDIRFDLASTNVTSPSRRTANNITTTNLTGLDVETVNVFHPKFHNINLSFTVNNVPLYKLIKAYRIVRSERIPEVLATGLLIGGVRENTLSGANNIIPYHKSVVRTPTFTFSTFPATTVQRDRNSNFGSAAVQNQNDIIIGNADRSQFNYFHSPDIYFNQTQYEYQAGDVIKILSVPVPLDEFTLQGFAGGDFESVYQEFTGYFDNTLVSYTDFSIAEARRFNTGEILAWGGAAKVKNGVSVPGDGITLANVNPFYSNMKGCTIFRLNNQVSASSFGDAGLFATGSGTYAKEGLVYAQIFRSKGAATKYPSDKTQSVYQTTNHYYILDGTERGVQNNVSVFGGDIFNQKSHLKIRMPGFQELNNGFGLGYSFYSQNISNTQMFYCLDHNLEQEGPGYVYPQYMEKFISGLNILGYNNDFKNFAFIRDWSPTITGAATPSNVVTYARVPKGSWGVGLMYWLEQWPEVDNQNNYDSQYSVIDNVFTETGYDEFNRWDGERPASIRWSQVKSTGSEKDNYRVFKPIDVVDLDTNEGEIVELQVINSNLYTLQPDALTRHYINDTQLISGAQGTEIVLGSGGVLTNKGARLSTYGATNKFAVVKGKSPSGDENMYWWNERIRKIMRFGGDGTRIISDKGLISYLMNQTQWSLGKQQPITGIGVTAGFNQRFYEVMFTYKAIITFIGDQQIVEFETYTTPPTIKQYPSNTIVINSHNGDVTSPNYPGEWEVSLKHISGLPYLYRKKQTSGGGEFTDTLNTVPQFGPSWATNWERLTPDTHPQYYQFFSVIYDEVKNGFISFISQWPNIMTTRTETFYSTKPDEENKIYVQNAGSDYNSFYDVGYSGHIEGVVNIDPNLSKTYEAIQVVSNTTPQRVDFSTRDHVSFLTSAEFEELEDFYYSAVKNDSTGTGVNSNDTSRLWGRFLKVKFIFASGAFQKLVNYVVKYRPNPRLYNR
jgi:hypothetical protein